MVQRTVAIALAFFMFTGSAWAGNNARNFGGVGIDGVPLPDGQIEVKQLVTGGPAHLAGIRVGDVITHVDSKPTRGSDFRDILEHRLRGRAGTKVILTIHRPGREKPLSFRLVRKQLVIGKQK
jgi:C-terminal processing protease CtpA/Prc